MGRKGTSPSRVHKNTKRAWALKQARAKRNESLVKSVQKGEYKKRQKIAVKNELTNTTIDCLQQEEAIQVINEGNIVNNTSPSNITEPLIINNNTSSDNIPKPLSSFNVSKESIKNWAIQCNLNCEELKSLANILKEEGGNELSLFILARLLECISKEEPFVEKTESNDDLNSISLQILVEKTQKQYKRSDKSVKTFSQNEIFKIMPLNDRESYAKFEEMLERRDVRAAYEIYTYEKECSNWETSLKNILDKTFTTYLVQSIKWFGICEKLGIRSSKTIQLIIDKIKNLYTDCNRNDIEDSVGFYFLEKHYSINF